MLTEVRYDPFSFKPYSVYIKHSTSWIKMGDYTDEISAVAFARSKSKQPDLPYKKVFSNGEQINQHGATI